jgi:hypothetical protein
MIDWSARIRAELETGKRAQDKGNEGMARVCARRAAGWAASAYLEKQGAELKAKSAFEKLIYIMDSGLLSRENRERLAWLTRSLDKDEPEGESYWPLDADLLEEAEKLAEDLLPEFFV